MSDDAEEDIKINAARRLRLYAATQRIYLEAQEQTGENRHLWLLARLIATLESIEAGIDAIEENMP